MKLLISIFLLLGSMQIAAANYDCSAALSDNYSVDSRSFKLNEFEVESDFDEDPSSFAVEAIEKLYSKLECVSAENKGGSSSVQCREVVEGISASRVCYLENDEGYFLISKDMMESVNVLYNRWD